MDHLALYRPGTGSIWILNKDSAGNFSPVYRQGDPGNGIGGFDLKSAADRAFAFDYDSSGKMDHLALYRPGTGTVWILNKDSAGISRQYIVKVIRVMVLVVLISSLRVIGLLRLIMTAAVRWIT